MFYKLKNKHFLIFLHSPLLNCLWRMLNLFAREMSSIQQNDLLCAILQLRSPSNPTIKETTRRCKHRTNKKSRQFIHCLPFKHSLCIYDWTICRTWRLSSYSDEPSQSHTAPPSHGMAWHCCLFMTIHVGESSARFIRC